MLRAVLALCAARGASGLAAPSRRQALAATAGGVAARFAVSPARAATTVSAKDGSFSFVAPAGFEEKPKPVRTHADEVLYKDAARNEIGVVVDRVKLASLREFGTPAFVGERVVASERGRDGVTEVVLESASPVAVGGDEYYEVAYANKSSRGDFRYRSRIAVRDGRLYVMTLKAHADDDDANKVLGGVLASFRVAGDGGEKPKAAATAPMSPLARALAG